MQDLVSKQQELTAREIELNSKIDRLRQQEEDLTRAAGLDSRALALEQEVLDPALLLFVLSLPVGIFRLSEDIFPPNVIPIIHMKRNWDNVTPQLRVSFQ